MDDISPAERGIQQRGSLECLKTQKRQLLRSGGGSGSPRDLRQLALVCSGRFLLEMVAKAAGMGIPVFVSPAAPSIEAVALAHSAGMMPCGRSSETGFTIYSHKERII